MRSVPAFIKQLMT